MWAAQKRQRVWRAGFLFLLNPLFRVKNRWTETIAPFCPIHSHATIVAIFFSFTPCVSFVLLAVFADLQVRGMLPRKTARGEEALARLSVRNSTITALGRAARAG